jgi:WD40 repeat-containing protein SMU1
MVFISCLVSPNCDFVYCLGDDCNLYCFDFATAELLSTIKAHEKEPFGLAHHPYLNILATYADGPLRIWKP